MQTHRNEAMTSEKHIADYERLWRKSLLIRRFEERLLDLFAEGALNGTVHTCVGQEWSGIAVAESLQTGDTVFSNHRGHGHYLARYADVTGLLAEVMGRSSGVSGGIGGTQHIFRPGFYSNGIQGGMVPSALGVALGYQIRSEPNVAVAFIGDGTLGEGILYESLNLASLWCVPLVVVVENNGYAQSTNTGTTIAGSIEKRAAAFDIRYWHGTTWQWPELMQTASEAIDHARHNQSPVLIEIKTYRLNAHSKGDDNRQDDEIKRFHEIDPINEMMRSHPEVISKIDKVELLSDIHTPCTGNRLILGAGGHAQVIADILLGLTSGAGGYQLFGYLDDNPALHGRMILDLPVLGPVSMVASIAYDVLLVGIGNNEVRSLLYERYLALGSEFARAVHVSAILAADTQVGIGTVVCANVAVNTGTNVAANAILNTGCTVDHHNRIGEHVHIGPGAHLGGDVSVDEGALIGIGATVMPQRSVGRWAIVGAGAVVTEDVPDHAVVAGVPARILRWRTPPDFGATGTQISAADPRQDRSCESPHSPTDSGN